MAEVWCILWIYVISMVRTQLATTSTRISLYSTHFTKEQLLWNKNTEHVNTVNVYLLRVNILFHGYADDILLVCVRFVHAIFKSKSLIFCFYVEVYR